MKKPQMNPCQKDYNYTFKEMGDLYHDVSLRAGLSDSAFDILYGIFCLGDGCLQHEICQTSCLPKQTLHSSIRKLESQGFLSRAPGRGRHMQVFLTDTGQQLMEQALYPIITAENRAVSSLTAEERRQLTRLFRKYTDALRTNFSQIP